MFRFTIRDVLWLMVVVGLAIGWGLEHRSIISERGVLDVERERLASQSSELDRTRALLKRSVDAVNQAIEKQQRQPSQAQ